jgi:glutamate synthase domain-containing protein 1
MCGIAGILNRDGQPVEEHHLTLITRALPRRGPDGEGLHIDGHVGLGHRRLANAKMAIDSLYQFVYDFENCGGSLMMPAWQIFKL